MGLFNFVKEAGEKLWDKLTDSHQDQGEKVTEHLKKLNIPGADKVQVTVVDGKASVTGDGLTQEEKEKFRLRWVTLPASVKWRITSRLLIARMKPPITP